ncbi:MAG TPA: hypothetical protein DCR93_31420, partial [Cytophagales bacterium]|nr:hypothetical protein [Cytophagales bacterium]
MTPFRRPHFGYTYTTKKRQEFGVPTSHSSRSIAPPSLAYENLRTMIFCIHLGLLLAWGGLALGLLSGGLWGLYRY